MLAPFAQEDVLPGVLPMEDPVGTRLENWEPSHPFVFVGFYRLPPGVCEVLRVPLDSLWRGDFGWDVWRDGNNMIVYTKSVGEVYYGDVPPHPPPPPRPPPRQWGTRRRWQRTVRHIIVGLEHVNVFEAGSVTSPWVRHPSIPPPPHLLRFNPY